MGHYNYLSIYLSICLSVYRSFYAYIYLSIYQCIYLAICLHMSVYLSVYLSIHLPTYTYARIRCAQIFSLPSTQTYGRQERRLLSLAGLATAATDPSKTKALMLVSSSGHLPSQRSANVYCPPSAFPHASAAPQTSSGSLASSRCGYMRYGQKDMDPI